MTTATEAHAATRRHREQQLALRAATLRDLQRLWPAFDPGDVGTFDRFLAGATTLVRARHADSAGLAANYYRTLRGMNGLSVDAPIVTAVRLPTEQVNRSLAITGLNGTYKALRAGFTPEAASRNGFVRVSGAASRLVLNGGRETVLQTFLRDRRGTRWRRVTGGDACDFCSDLAGRGAVYKEETSDFPAHDHCSCVAEPEF